MESWSSSSSSSSGEGGKKRVCVTGGSGFIASWLVKLLLGRGYLVNATVRSLKDPTKTENLLALEGAKERLRLFEADLLEEGSFDAAIHGCHGVFHTASPVMMDPQNPQEEVIDPAVKGTLNVLASCARTPSLKRVVFTSSVAAVLHCGRPLTEETLVDESWFSTPQGCLEASRAKWYMLSKTLAEEAAWKFAQENGLDMVSMNPAGVIGPILLPRHNSFTSFVCAIFNGTTETYPNMTSGWVHVKDVAEAHVRAFEIPSANGRYILCERVTHASELVRILRDLYPHLKFNAKCDDEKPLMSGYRMSKDKVRSLGMEYIPLEVAVKEGVESLKEMKFVHV